MVVFGRLWYPRPMIQPAMGYCTKWQYHYFMNRVNEWEQGLVAEDVSGRIPGKYISAGLLRKPRFKLRVTSDLRYWKYSANDLMAAERWRLITYSKERMFSVTPTEYAPRTHNQLGQQATSPDHRILARFGYEESGLVHPCCKPGSRRSRSY